jgi:O-antigen/teichoic acid export membrane protein
VKTVTPSRSGGRFLWRLAGFTGLPLFSVLTPLVLLPILARITTPGVWSSIGIGQSVGSFAAIVISFGWALKGPAIIAQSSRNERPGLYAESLVARSFVLVGSVPLVVAIVIGLTKPQSRVIGISMALAMAFSGLSAAWYNIGEGRASDIAIYEALPRLVATVAAAAGLAIFREPLIYPALIGVSTVTGVALFSRKVCGSVFLSHIPNFSLRQSLRRAAPSALTMTAGGAYSTSAVAIVGIGAPTASHAAYVSGDKIYGMGLFAVTALANALQGWIGEVTDGRAWERMKTAVAAHAFVGFIGALLLGIFGPAVTRILYGEGLEAPRGVMIWLGVAFLFVSLNTAVGRLTLIPLGQDRAVLTSTLFGALVGVPLLVGGALVAGAAGGAFGLAVSQVVVLVVQVIALLRFRVMSGSGDRLVQRSGSTSR